ncbi:hypothetical protein [Staphylococcus felis]|nr:hypothetical protein [Staphylococcus felis]MDM8327589.1 hypothetical protein [Staphylococcus felis]MDQ7193813.1 hypothetical protein [Staphylococcus felis]
MMKRNLFSKMVMISLSFELFMGVILSNSFAYASESSGQLT